MEKGDLVEVLLQRHDECVNKLENLGEIEEPNDLGHGQAVLGLINGVAPEGIIGPDGCDKKGKERRKE